MLFWPTHLPGPWLLPLAVAIVLCLVSGVFGFVVLGWSLPVFHWPGVSVVGVAAVAALFWQLVL